MARTSKKSTSRNKKKTADSSEAPTTGRGSGRHRTQTKRLLEANDHAKEEKAKRAAIKNARLIRAAERSQRAKEDVTVEKPDDSEEVIKLKGEYPC